MEKKYLRREPRVDHKMPITLHFGDGAKIYDSQNVAYRGLFLETPNPLPLNRLVKITADLEETTVEFLAVVARRVNTYENPDPESPPGMGLAIHSIGPDDAERWESFVKDLYDMDEEARRHIESKQLNKLHLVVGAGEDLLKLVSLAKTENYIDFQSTRPLSNGAKHLLTISHSSDHNLRARLRVEINDANCDDNIEPQGVYNYRLNILEDELNKNNELDKLTIGE